MEERFKNSVVEALILASPEPLPSKKISDMIEDLTPSKVGKAVAELNSRYMETGSSFRIRELAGGYQFYVLSEYTGFVEEMFARRRKMRLTRAALETLAIVAYKQPVTKREIEQIRGVASDGVLHNLLEKTMLTIKGRAATVGKPLQYGTTDDFLKFFGLNKLDDLPKMSEIEALIVSTEELNQTELHFEGKLNGDDNGIKLNVADGSFQPEETQSSESDSQEQAVESDQDEISLESDEISEDNTPEKDDNTEDGIIVDLDQT